MSLFLKALGIFWRTHPAIPPANAHKTPDHNGKSVKVLPITNRPKIKPITASPMIIWILWDVA
jgi:hypothetical protein